MKGKQSKQKEDEALKLAEEQKKREEEERIQKEEAKKYNIVILPTGLPLTFTEYYMTEAMKTADCQLFTNEYIQKVLQKSYNVNNFRPIDMAVLVDEIVYNLVFAKIEAGWDDIKAQILVNMLFEVYKYQSPKFMAKEVQEEKVQDTPASRSSSKKTTRVPQKNKENDWRYFKELVSQHCSEGTKYFNAQELRTLLDYVRKTYFAHQDLLVHVSRSDQRPLEIILNLQIEKPPTIPPLSAATNYIPFQKAASKEFVGEQSHEVIHQEELPPRELTDEELLEPEVLALLEQRLLLTKEQLEQKLAKRQAELDEKVLEQQSVKK